MATILEFTGVHTAASGDVADSDGSSTSSAAGSAQIIFFPGVRIERYDIDPFEDEAASEPVDRVTSSNG